MARDGHDGPIRLEATLNARDFYAHAGFHEIMHSTVRRNGIDVPVVIMEYMKSAKTMNEPVKRGQPPLSPSE